jgi:CcmD family protein
VKAIGYLFAAYTATWIIHIAYLGTIVGRYSRLKREIKPGPSPQEKINR